jgi:hypothetical protein
MLSMTMTHSGTITQGTTGVQLTIAIQNKGASASSAPVVVALSIPTGLTFKSLTSSTTGSNPPWSINTTTLTATRDDSLAAGASYDNLVLTVDVDATPPKDSNNNNISVFPVSATLSSGNGPSTQVIYDVINMSATKLAITSPTTATVGVPFNITVSTTNDNDVVETNYNDQLQITATDPQANIPSPTILANGTGTFRIALNTAGTITVAIIDQTNTSIVGTPLHITVSAAGGASSQVAVMALHVPTGAALNASALPPPGVYFFPQQVTNSSATAINGFRLHVSGLPDGAALVNASNPAGSNDIYAEYPYPLDVNQTVSMTLQISSANPLPDGYVPTVTIELLSAPPTAVTDLDPVQISSIKRLPDGTMQLQFPTVPGHWYRVKFSADLVNWTNSQVPVLATDATTTWVDNGPPVSDSHPAILGSRYYKVNDVTP